MDVEYGQSPQQQNSGKYSLEFSDQSIRRQFVKKVFIIVTIMLTVVAVMCSLPMAIKPFGDWLSAPDGSGWILVTVSSIAFIVVSIMLFCCHGLRRTYPANIILLSLFTLSAGCMTMCVTGTYTVTSVLLCMVITALVSAAIVVFAIFIKKDLTSMIGILFVISMTLFFFGMIALLSILIFDVYWLYVVYSVLAALLMMVYLAVDVQLIMGGRRYEINPEEHILAAMMLFLDVLNIFLFLLAIFGRAK